MNRSLASFLFENSPWPPFLSCWLVGFCTIDSFGQARLTQDGQDYLDHRASEGALTANGQAIAEDAEA